MPRPTRNPYSCNNAATNYEKGSSLVSELVELTKPIGRPEQKDLLTLKQISMKLETAIKTFKAVPSDTTISELAQERIDFYSEDYQNLQSTIEALETCDLKRASDCKGSQSVRMLID